MSKLLKYEIRKNGLSGDYGKLYSIWDRVADREVAVICLDAGNWDTELQLPDTDGDVIVQKISHLMYSRLQKVDVAKIADDVEVVHAWWEIIKNIGLSIGTEIAYNLKGVKEEEIIPKSIKIADDFLCDVFSKEMADEYCKHIVASALDAVALFDLDKELIGKKVNDIIGIHMESLMSAR